jgi:hypothetical protein
MGRIPVCAWVLGRGSGRASETSISYTSTPNAHQSTARPYSTSRRICHRLAKVSDADPSSDAARAHLGCHELGSAAKCIGERGRPIQRLAEAIVGQAHVAVEAQQDVVQLQIAVNVRARAGMCQCRRTASRGQCTYTIMSLYTRFMHVGRQRVREREREREMKGREQACVGGGTGR